MQLKQLAKEKIKKILVIRRNNIGDMICAIPLLKTLRKEFPEARITVFADETNADVIRGASFIDKVLVYKRGKGIYRNRYVNSWKLLRDNKERFDMTVAVKIGFSSLLAFITLASGSWLRVGCIPRNSFFYRCFYNLPVRNYKRLKPLHQVNACLELLKTVGINSPTSDIKIEIDESSKKFAASFFRDNGIVPEQKKVVFNVSCTRKRSLWPLENFIAMGDVLFNEYGATCIFTCAPHDKAKARLTCNMTKGRGIFCETPGIMDFAAVVGASLLLICSEGGAMHIGTAVNTPTIAFLGKMTMRRWYPYGERQFLIKNNHISTIGVDDVIRVIKANNLL